MFKSVEGIKNKDMYIQCVYANGDHLYGHRKNIPCEQADIACSAFIFLGNDNSPIVTVDANRAIYASHEEIAEIHGLSGYVLLEEDNKTVWLRSL